MHKEPKTNDKLEPNLNFTVIFSVGKQKGNSSRTHTGRSSSSPAEFPIEAWKWTANKIKEDAGKCRGS